MRKRPKKILHGLTALTLSGVALLTGCGKGGEDSFDMLDRIADFSETETETEMAEEKEAVKTESNTETETETETEAGILPSSRPEYDPEEYVEVCDLSKLEVTLDDKHQVTDEEAMEQVRRDMVTQGIFSGGETARKGDILNISYTITEKGKKAADVIVDDSDIYLGQNVLPAEVEKKLTGLKEKQSVEVNHTYDDNYEDVTYKGKTFTFCVTVNKIKSLQLTDAVAGKLSGGEYHTAESYLTHVKENLQKMEDEAWEEQTGRKLVQAACDACNRTGFPSDTLTYDLQRRYIQYYINANGQAFDEYIRTLGFEDEVGFATYVKDMVEENLDTEMRVLALAKACDIWLDDDALSKEIVKLDADYDDAETYYHDYSKYHAQYEVAKTKLDDIIMEKVQITD